MKQRLDKIIVDRGLAETRAKAQALIIAGEIRVNGAKADKSGTLFDENCEIEMPEKIPWVSRGAFKLLHAFEAFPINVEGKVCVDIGASTGGFVEVLLSRGAARVYAVDVGYGQLAWKLATDARVVVMDRTNGRELSAANFAERVEFVSTDASFISLRLLLPAIEKILVRGGDAVVLIKPQFEAGRERVGKGIIRDDATRDEIVEEVLGFIRNQTSFLVKGLTPSPIRGQKGNVEYLCWLKKTRGADKFAQA